MHYKLPLQPQNLLSINIGLAFAVFSDVLVSQHSLLPRSKGDCSFQFPCFVCYADPGVCFCSVHALGAATDDSRLLHLAQVNDHHFYIRQAALAFLFGGAWTPYMFPELAMSLHYGAVIAVTRPEIFSPSKKIGRPPYNR